MKNDITIAILKIRDIYLEKEMPDGSTYWDINNGNCEDFAKNVIKYLTIDGRETDSLYCVVNENFQINNKWDRELISKYWSSVKPLNNLSWDETNKIIFGRHMWITDGNYHYDAECPEGTKNFFNLPIFMRSFSKK
jgi:hypothetical protein